MQRRHCLGASVLWLAACWVGAAPPVKITGPANVDQYKIVELQVEGDITGAAIFWEIRPEDVADQRELPGGKLLFVAPPGTYKIRALIVRTGDKGLVGETQRFTVTIGAPKPPVPPMPPGPDPPTPTPTVPIAGPGFRVLIVYETADLPKLTEQQRNVIYTKTVRDLLNEKCVVGPDGKTKDWWILDQNSDVSAMPKRWQDAFKRERKTLPWLVISNPEKGVGFEGPLPADANATVDLIKKYAP